MLINVSVISGNCGNSRTPFLARSFSCIGLIKISQLLCICRKVKIFKRMKRAVQRLFKFISK